MVAIDNIKEKVVTIQCNVHPSYGVFSDSAFFFDEDLFRKPNDAAMELKSLKAGRYACDGYRANITGNPNTKN